MVRGTGSCQGRKEKPKLHAGQIDKNKSKMLILLLLLLLLLAGCCCSKETKTKSKDRNEAVGLSEYIYRERD